MYLVPPPPKRPFPFRRGYPSNASFAIPVLLVIILQSCTFSCSSDGGKAKGKKVNKAKSVTVIINKKKQGRLAGQGKARHGKGRAAK